MAENLERKKKLGIFSRKLKWKYIRDVNWNALVPNLCLDSPYDAQFFWVTGGQTLFCLQTDTMKFYIYIDNWTKVSFTLLGAVFICKNFTAASYLLRLTLPNGARTWHRSLFKSLRWWSVWERIECFRQNHWFQNNYTRDNLIESQQVKSWVDNLELSPVLFATLHDPILPLVWPTCIRQTKLNMRHD